MKAKTRNTPNLKRLEPGGGPTRGLPPSRRLVRWTRTGGAALLAAVALAACSEGGGENPVTPTPPDQPDDPVQKADVASTFNAIPAWDEISPPVAESQDLEEGDPEGESSLLDDSDGRYSEARVCTATPYSLSKNPDQIITMSPDQGLLVPGVLLQGRSHVLGSLQQLQIDQRAPIDLVINETGAGNPSLEVERPSLGSLQAAVNELIQDAQTSGFQYGSDISFNQVTSHASQQAALGLGLSARYLTGSAAAQLQSQTSAEETTVTASFIQNAFSIRADGPAFAGDWFTEDFTQDVLDQYLNSGQIGPDSPPLLVLEVTYGRIVAVNFTSSRSQSEIEAFFEGSYTNGVGSIEGRVSAEQERMIQEARIQVVSLGGPAEGGFQFAKEILSPDDPSTIGLDGFFAQDVSLTTFKPISYVIADLRTGTVARVGEITEYEVLECADRAESTFDDGSVDGWSAENHGAFDVAGPIDSHAGAGSLYARGGNDDTTWFYAGGKFLGDKSAYVGGRLSYWTKWRGPTQADSDAVTQWHPDVRIESAESPKILIWTAELSDFPPNQYVKRELAFEPSDRLLVYNPSAGQAQADAVPATRADIEEVLADIARIRIIAELRGGGGVEDTGWIDEVQMIPGFVPPEERES